jgi:hypothetical protein
MTVYVNFLTSAPISTGLSQNAGDPGINSVRIKEALALDATSSGVTVAGEMIRLYNAETAAIMFAFGTTPLAATTAATTTSSAGIPVAAGQFSDVIICPAGTKVQVKALA